MQGTAGFRSDKFALLSGLVLLLLTAGYYCLRPAIVLGDPDIWWHVQTGRDIVATLRVPYADHYSYTFDGQPWIAKEWLSQVLLALAFKTGGWSGVMLLSVLAVAAALVALYLELGKHLRLEIAAAIVLVCAVVLTPVVIARPHIFTLLPMVVLTARLFGAAARQKPPEYWLLALVVLWANLHGSFTFALVIAGFAFLAIAEASRLTDRPLLVKWLIFLVLAATATLATPYGLTNYTINLSMISGNETMPFITEWQPFSAQRDRIMEYGLLAGLAALIATRARLGWTRVAFLIFTLHMFLLHVRFVYVFFLLAPLVVAAPAAETLAAMARLTARAKTPDAVQEFLSRRFPPIMAGLAGVIALAIAAVVVSQPFVPEKRRSIEDALAYVHANHLDGPVFNGYNLGGVLIFNGIKTYLDGRTEQLFRGDFMTGYLASGNADGAGVVQEIVNRYKTTWAIFPKKDIRNSFLATLPGWHQAYEDDYVIIHVRSAP